MPVNVVMPRMGESVVEGTIVAWLKKPGDPVREDEPLVEVETEKINVEIPSPASGVLLKVLAGEGDTIPVDETIAVIGAEGEDAAAAPPHPAQEEPSRVEEGPVAPETPPRPAPEAPEPGTLKVLASPAVRRLARRLGVDLSQVAGTGRMGRVTKEDAEAASAAPEGAATGPPAADEDEEVVPLTPMRRAIAEHMVRSRREAPHVTTVAEVDMTDVAALRAQWYEQYAEAGVKLTYMAFILHALARALKDYPELNASWTEKGIVLKYRIHLGIAVAVSEGLVVPVIRNADRLSVWQMASAVQAIAEKTHNGKVSASEVGEGTFTVTNPGVFGAVISTPIIHQPQSAILATGRIADAAAVVNGGLCVRKRMFMSLSYDHRVVDGATAVRFLQALRRTLEGADFDCSADAPGGSP
jgi:2-oxoisovalerate dehydrogenase E2 component (dihydrolipoyl transacylase)